MPGLRSHAFHSMEHLSYDEEPLLRLGAIGESESLFLRSMRGWSKGHEGLTEVWNEYARRFGAADGRLLLHLFCSCYSAIRLAAKRPIRHHAPCCPYLAPDELRLTALFCASALGRVENTLFAAHLLLNHDEMPAVLSAVSRLGSAYAARGLPVSPASPLSHYSESAAGTT